MRLTALPPVLARAARHPGVDVLEDARRRVALVAWIDERRARGMARDEACRVVGISPRSYTRWRLRLRAHGCGPWRAARAAQRGLVRPGSAARCVSSSSSSACTDRLVRRRPRGACSMKCSTRGAGKSVTNSALLSSSSSRSPTTVKGDIPASTTAHQTSSTPKHVLS